MIEFVLSVLREAWFLTASMALYLLLGFTVAGFLKVFLTMGFVSRHVGGESRLAVFKASVIGVPLPLCSCGVLPVAASLRAQGAGRAPTLSFLITTPVTGIDSLLATWALLGPVFTFVRLAVSFVLGIAAGLVAAVVGVERRAAEVSSGGECDGSCSASPSEPEVGLARKLGSAVRYAYIDLPSEISGSILLGLVLGGVIVAAFPPTLIERYIGTGVLGILVSIVIAIPLYVCATGSIPIAAAMMLKGFSPGAALAFLIAGPATNTVAMATVKKLLGTRPLLVYLGVIFTGALGFGLLFDVAVRSAALGASSLLNVSGRGLSWVHIAGGVLLISLLATLWIKQTVAKVWPRKA